MAVSPRPRPPQFLLPFQTTTRMMMVATAFTEIGEKERGSVDGPRRERIVCRDLAFTSLKAAFHFKNIYSKLPIIQIQLIFSQWPVMRTLTSTTTTSSSGLGRAAEAMSAPWRPTTATVRGDRVAPSAAASAWRHFRTFHPRTNWRKKER